MKGVKGGILGTDGASKFKVQDLPWNKNIDHFNGSYSELMKDKGKKQRKIKEKKISSIHSLASQYHTM